MPANTKDQPLDPRRKEAHPERIVVGGLTYERGDITARKYGESVRSQNRRDREGAPYQYFGNIKYRPEPHYDNFIVRRHPTAHAVSRRSAAVRHGAEHGQENERRHRRW